MRFLRRFFIRLSNFTAGRRADRWHWTREVKVPHPHPNERIRSQRLIKNNVTGAPESGPVLIA
jgi:hypothetical protein